MRLIVPNGREAEIAQGGGAPKLRLSLFLGAARSSFQPLSSPGLAGRPSNHRSRNEKKLYYDYWMPAYAGMTPG